MHEGDCFHGINARSFYISNPCRRPALFQPVPDVFFSLHFSLIHLMPPLTLSPSPQLVQVLSINLIHCFCLSHSHSLCRFFCLMKMESGHLRPTGKPKETNNQVQHTHLSFKPLYSRYPQTKMLHVFTQVYMSICTLRHDK